MRSFGMLRIPQSGTQIGSYCMLLLIMCDGLAGCEREGAGQPPSPGGMRADTLWPASLAGQ
jgi:hypothetical protein